MKCWIWRDRWHRSGNNGIRVQIWTLRVSQTWTYMYVIFLVFGALSLFDKILLLFSFLFLHFNRVNWVIIDTLDLFGPFICWIVFFLLKVFFRTKWKKNGDRSDWWQLKGTIKGHGGRRPMIPKSLICCSGAVQRMIWSWVLFRSGYPEISKFACSGFCLAFSKFQLPLPCSSSSKSWILDHLML